jgi:lipase
MTIPYDTFDIPVPGGLLHVGRWGQGDTVVLASHGLTGNHKSFHMLADLLGPGTCVVAPDLRGRGQSRNISGPFSLTQHAEDVSAVLQHLNVTADIALGHSMGAYVVLLLAARHPERARRLILVDGGLPRGEFTAAEPALDNQSQSSRASVAARIGPAFERLSITFPSVDAYLQRWKSHPSFADDWNDYISEGYEYDLVGEPPDLRSSVREDAVLADAESLNATTALGAALSSLTQPVVHLRAPRGIMNEEPGLYPEEVVAHWQSRVPQLRSVLIPDVNHYTIVKGTAGGRQLADLVRQELAAEKATDAAEPS